MKLSCPFIDRMFILSLCLLLSNQTKKQITITLAPMEEKSSCSFKLPFVNYSAQSCRSLSPPPKALPYKCDKGENYGSVCVLQCNRQAGYAANKGHVTRCKEDGSWSETNLQCKGSSRPTRFICCTSLADRNI